MCYMYATYATYATYMYATYAAYNLCYRSPSRALTTESRPSSVCASPPGPTRSDTLSGPAAERQEILEIKEAAVDNIA